MRLLVVPIILGLFSVSGCGGTPAPEPLRIPTPAEPDPPRVRIENPQYLRWSAFPVGTVLVQRSLTGDDDNEAKTTTITTVRLVEKTDSELKLSMQSTTKRFDEMQFENAPEILTTSRHLTLPPGVSPPASDTGEGAEETISIAGKEYKTRRSTGTGQVEAGKAEYTLWMTDSIPGGLVKSITRIPALKKTITLEVVEIRIP